MVLFYFTKIPYKILKILLNITMIRLIKLVIWLVIITGGILFWNYISYENTLLTQEETQIEITGGGFQSALINAGASPLFTKIYLRENTPDFELQK